MVASAPEIGYYVITPVRTEDELTTIKLPRVGNSVGAVIPKETLARMNVDVGDTLYLTESPDGFRLTPYNPEFGAQMITAERIMKRRRSALRKLAQ